jgi:hypothetical protein
MPMSIVPRSVVGCVGWSVISAGGWVAGCGREWEWMCVMEWLMSWWIGDVVGRFRKHKDGVGVVVKQEFGW